MGTTYTNYSQYDNASVYVSTSAELNAAVKQLAAGNGGTVKVDPNGGPYDLSVHGVGSSKSPVLIESASGAKPLFESVSFTNSEYIAIDGINLDTSHMSNRGSGENDVTINNSSNIEMVNSDIVGNAKGYLSEATSGDVRGITGAYVTDSEDVLFAGNYFSNYMYTTKFVDTKGLTFVENEVTQWQADGIHAGGLQDTVIEGNYLHNPLGSTQTLAHSDFIQIRMVSTGLVNKNIEIAGNIMDTEGGPAAQGIHMGNAGSGNRSYDISIHDNIIHTALPRGIGVDSVTGLDVYNNTVLWDESSWVQDTPGAAKESYDPRILLNGQDTNIHSNIASWIRMHGKVLDEGGYQISYSNSSAANHVDKHIENLDGSGNPNSYDLSIKQSSALYGKFGASASWDGLTVISRPVEVDEDDGGLSAEPLPDTGSDASDAVHLYLVDPKTDNVVRELSSTDEVSTDELSTGAYNLKAVYDGGKVGSVEFWRDGELMHTENGAPYAAFGDTKGDYWNGDLPDGGTLEGLEIKVYSGKNGSGSMLHSQSYEITYTAEEPALPDEVEGEDDTPIVGDDTDAPANLVHLYLVDPKTDDVVRELSSTDDISADELSSGAYNLKAVYDGGKVGSVEFWRNGEHMHTENGAPYAAFGDTKGDFKNGDLPEGGSLEDLEIKVYSGKNGAGALLYSQSYEIGYAAEEEDDTPVVDDDTDAPESQVHLYLIDPETDDVIRELSSVDDIGSGELSTGAYNLKAVYDGGKVGSVEFWRDGEHMHTENGAPYAAFGDTKGDFWDGDLPEDGTLEDLEIKIYSGKNGTGALLDSQTFEIGYSAEQEEPEVVEDEVEIPVVDETEDEAPEDMVHLYLVDPETDEVLRELSSVDEVGADELSSGAYNLKAVYDGGSVGSMQFFKGDTLVNSENSPPFAAFGDMGGDFFNEEIPEGDDAQGLEVRVYSGKNGEGEVLDSRTFEISFAGLDDDAAEDDDIVFNDDVVAGDADGGAGLGQGAEEDDEAAPVDDDTEEEVEVADTFTQFLEKLFGLFGGGSGNEITVTRDEVLDAYNEVAGIEDVLPVTEWDEEAQDYPDEDDDEDGQLAA